MSSSILSEADPALLPVEINLSPGAEYREKARKWQGIPGIERAAGGRLWAAWYTGGRTEDKDNHIVLVSSEDEGVSWSEPVLVIDPAGIVRAADPVLWHDPRGRLWLFWMQTGAHDRSVFDGRAGVWAIFSENSQEASPGWSEPQRIANGVMMNKPTALSSGDWLLPIAVWSHHPAPYLYSLPEEEFSSVYVSRDEGKTFSFLGKSDVPNRTCDEHMIVERKDGSLWMLVRRRDGIGEAFSRDGGKTWDSAPDIVLPGPNARFHIRRLLSGRLLLINHHEFTRRSHLTAMLSDDDGLTWPHKVLLDERADAAYPDAVESPDGKIHIIYDRRRVGEGEILLQTLTEDEIIKGQSSGKIIVVSHVHRTDIGDRLELFVDDELIDRTKNVALKLHQPVRQEAALVTDQPWEGNAVGYVSVMQDGDILRMYYKMADTREGIATKEERYTHPMWVCYAESRDGLKWDRPELGLHEFEGSTANNIVFKGIGELLKGVHGFTPFRDTNPDCLPEERYKVLAGAGESGLREGSYALCSPDGLHWSLMQEEPVLRQIIDGAFDSQTLAFWDKERAEYRIYFRDYFNREDKINKVRVIKTARSSDFIHWDEMQLLDYNSEALPVQLYTNQIQPYFRAPHILLGFPTRYIQRSWSPAIEALPELPHRQWRTEVFFERYGAALTDGLFMSSRDRTKFYRWDEAFVRPGPQIQGNWMYGDNYQGAGLFLTDSALEGAPQEISFLVTEHTARSTFSVVRRMSIRVDGFVSVQAPMAGGELTLVPLWFNGNRLRLNFSTSAAGSIRVEIQDFSGKALPGFALDDCHEIIGDEIDRTVAWKGGSDLGAIPRQLVRLRFVMADADLFSFQFYTES